MGSIVKMQKITLVAHKRDRRRILNVLTELGTAEITKGEEYENTVFSADSQYAEEVQKKLNRLIFAFEFLKEADREIKKEKKGLPKNTVPEYTLDVKRENRLVDYGELSEITNEEYELFNVISDLETANSQLTDIKAEKTRLTNLLNQIGEYSALDIKFSDIKDTAHTKLFVGLVPNSALTALAAALPENAVLRSSPNASTALVSVFAHNDDVSDVINALSAADFAKCPYEYDSLAADIIAEASAKIVELDEKRKTTLLNIVESMDEVPRFKLLYDFYYLEKTKIDVSELNRETKKAFILDFWTPAALSQFTIDKIKKVCPSAEAVVRDPVEGEVVPTLTKDAKVVEPFAVSITSTFGLPEYGKLNPNPFVAFFFFLFFGFMLSDAGYGIVMTLGCFAYLLIKKPVKTSGSFIAMLGICGISTIMWGAIFGGWFAISEATLSTNALGRFLLTFKCIDPLDGNETLIMFGLALGLGVIQIGVGFFLSGLGKIKEKNIGGVLSDWAWVTVFIGAALFLLNMLVNNNVLNVASIAVIGLGVLMLVVGGAFGKKNPLKMLIGAFKNIYGTVSVFSDILSYARLFGLGLCTGVIGMVFNKLGLVFVDMMGAAGYIFAVIIWIVGHTFNIAINTLGVYVHNSRLQYVEFFGKFYEGGGHAFNPLGSKTKYIFLNDKMTADKMSKKLSLPKLSLSKNK